MAQLIGELLVRAGALSPADLEEAVGWQVLYGGRLGTNMLELGVVSERALAEALGRQLGCECAWGELDVSASMVQMIPAVLARRHEIVPWKLDGRKLKVVTSHPADAMPILDELGFRTGKVVRPVVVPEFRIHQLLRRHFQSVRQMRALDFGQKVNRRAAPKAAESVAAPGFNDGAELMDDEQFAALYSHALEGRGASPNPSEPDHRTPPPILGESVAPPERPAHRTPTPGPPPPQSAPPVLVPSRLVIGAVAGDMPVVPSRPIGAPLAPPALDSAPNDTSPVDTSLVDTSLVDKSLVGATPVGVVQQAVDEDDEILEGEILEGEFVEELDESDFIVEVAPSDDEAIGETFDGPVDSDDVSALQPAGGHSDEGEETEEAAAASAMQWAAAFQELERELSAKSEVTEPVLDASPLSFDQAVREIAQADGREAVARAVLRYARSRAARAVLLAVQGNVALGWDAVGEDLSPEVARRIAFPLTSPSAFRLVRQSRSHYIGPLGPEPGNVRFLKLAGKKWPASAVLLPVLFRGRVVYVLYVDNGHRKHVDADVGELLILSQNITRSMESLVSRKQLVAQG